MLDRASQFVKKPSDQVFVRFEILPNEDFSYEAIRDDFCLALEDNAKRFLVDKRHFKTAIDDNLPPKTALEFGHCLSEHDAKLAIVLDENDHVGKVMGMALVQAGAQVLSTFQMTEAIKWLSDEIN